MARKQQYTNAVTGKLSDAKSPRMADTIGSTAQDRLEVHMHKDSTTSPTAREQKLRALESRLDHETAKQIPAIIARECGMRSRAYRLVCQMVERFTGETR